MNYWLRHPWRGVRRIWDRTVNVWRLRSMSGVTVSGRVRLEGMPYVELDPGASLRLGDGVTLNSSNVRYHVNLFSRVKIFVEEGGVVEIGSGSRLHGVCVHASESIRIGAECLIAGNTQIMDTSGHEVSFEDLKRRLNTRDKPRPVVIEDHVWIGAGCTVLPGVRIGRGSVVGAGSVVAKDIPPMVIAAGVPARVIRSATGSP